MSQDIPETDEARAGHREDLKIIEKFTGLCLNSSPLKHGEVMRLDKMDPTQFLQMQFKSFGQQSEFTKQAFTFCMKKNMEVNEQAMALTKQIQQPVKKKKAWHPKEKPGYGNGDDPEYFPGPLRSEIPLSINWSRELDSFQNSVLPLDDFETEMHRDPNITAENSITLNEEIGQSSAFVQESSMRNDFWDENFISDDFGGDNLRPDEVERQFLQLLPPEMRNNMTSTFPVNQSILENNFTHFEVPQMDQLRISPEREVPVVCPENFSLLSRDENLADQQLTKVKRLSKSPRQPFMSVNDTNEIPEVLQPPSIQVPDQIPLISDTLNELQPQVVPEIEPVLQVQPTEEATNDPPPQLLLPNLTGVSETEPVVRQRRARNVPATIEGHNAPKYGRFVKHQYRNLRLVDPEDDDDDEEIVNASFEFDSSDPSKLLSAMKITDKDEDTDLRNIIAEIASKSTQISQIIMDRQTILRPSTSLTKKSTPRRASTLRDQVQNSSIPLISTLEHLINDQQQHLDSAVINTQHVNINLTDIQRKINKTSEQTPINETPVVVPLVETPAIQQVQQIQDEQFEIQHQPLPQNLVNEQESRNMDQLTYTDNEKDFIKMFAKILTVCSMKEISEIVISDIIRFPNLKEFATLMKLSWETQKVIEIIKDDRTNKATHVKLIGYDAVFAA